MTAETPWSEYAIALAAAAVCTGACRLLSPHLELTNLIMVYLVGALLVAARGHRIPAALFSVLAVLCFDFFFVPPRFSFGVSDSEYVVTFVVMLAVSLTISGLTLRLHAQAESARQDERGIASRHALSQRLAGTRGVEATLQTGTRHLAEVFDSEVAALIPGPGARLEPRSWSGERRVFDNKEMSVAEWVYTAGRPAGIGAQALPVSNALYAPLLGSSGPIGVLRIEPRTAERLLDPKSRILMDSFCSQIALALEADRLQEDARRAELRAETERLRSSLLSAVSHDLKTPLAAIMGSASELIREGRSAKSFDSLAENIRDEAERLARLVNNLLETTRLESGVSLRKEPYALEEVLGSALESLSRQLGERPVRTDLPEELPLVPLDAVLLQQVFINLIENAIRHAPGAGPIEVSARREADHVVVEVSDRGPGLPADDLERIFEKFHRGASGGGAGLGLAICRAVVEAHRGNILARNREGGGAVFRFTLPLREGE
jgi:two-component system sensor histidine kinase KdpD